MRTDSRTLVVVVLHGMDWAASPARDSLLRSGAELPVVVFCNGPAASATPPEPGFEVVADGRNPGVGPRYLQAAHRAAERGDSFVLLLDQDFAAPAGWWAPYEAAVADHPTASCWGPTLRRGALRLSPFRSGRGRPDARSPLPGSLLDCARFGALNSGLLVRVDALFSASRELQAAPLYFSDLALFHRLGRSGARLALVDLVLEHDLSALRREPSAIERKRFSWFCHGARGYCSLDPSLRAGVGRWTFLRAALLSLRSLDPRFFAIWKRQFLDGLPPEAPA